MEKYDFSGWATRNDLQCADGRIIRKDAFKQQNGQTVSLVWNHQHNSQDNVLGHALLENRDEGVYAYCKFNDTESGKTAKKLVQHGDVVSLSIWANQLRQNGQDVVHGMIRELSLVLAGSNPGAFIDVVMAHGADADPNQIEELVASYNENIMLYHSDETGEKDKKERKEGDNGMNDDEKKKEDSQSKEEETLKEIFDTLTEKQKNVVYEIIRQIVEEKEKSDDNDDDNDDGNNDDQNKGGKIMKHNVFDQNGVKESTFLSHSDQESIVSLAKQNSIGTLRTALRVYIENNEDVLAHDGMTAIEDYDKVLEALFPDFRDVRPGAPERITRDQGYVTAVMDKAYKTPFSRIRTRQLDARNDRLRARGYKKKGEKADRGSMALYNRTTDPQTIYVKDKLNRDDIIDITDFDAAAYIYQDMREKLNEEIAIAVLVGDGREAGEDGKIDETHLRPIWLDDEFFTIHADVDIEKAKKELQGTNTGANFSSNYIYSEAIVQAALYAREDYKGSGTPDFYCTPHLINVMLLARDLNGRRIYDTVSDLAKALNVGNIYPVELFEGLERTDSERKKKKLLGLFVNMTDYTIGATKGGEITRFNQFDIDFNQEKYLLETRLSGALTRYHSAIALEELSEGE